MALLSRVRLTGWLITPPVRVIFPQCGGEGYGAAPLLDGAHRAFCFNQAVRQGITVYCHSPASQTDSARTRPGRDSPPVGGYRTHESGKGTPRIASYQRSHRGREAARTPHPSQTGERVWSIDRILR